MDQLRKLVRFTLWANESWIQFIGKRFPSDEYLLKRMSHVLLGEQAWFQRVSDEVPDREIWRTMSIAELQETFARHQERYRMFLDGDLDRVIRYQRFTGEKYQSPVSDILLHAALHGTHHRGQMATYVSSQGVSPINTDFIQFCLTQSL